MKIDTSFTDPLPPARSNKNIQKSIRLYQQMSTGAAGLAVLSILPLFGGVGDTAHGLWMNRSVSQVVVGATITVASAISTGVCAFVVESLGIAMETLQHAEKNT